MNLLIGIWSGSARVFPRAMVCHGPLPEPIERLWRCCIEVKSAEFAQRVEPVGTIGCWFTCTRGDAYSEDGQTAYDVDSAPVSTLGHADAYEARIG